MGVRFRAVAALVLGAWLVAAAGMTGAAHGQSPGAVCGTNHWVGAWTAAPSGTPGTVTSNQTLRLVLTPHVGAGQLRVHISNRYSIRPLTITRAAVALRASGAAVVAGSGRPLGFGGQAGVTIPAGGEATSDPAPLDFGAFQDLAVSLYLADTNGAGTGHLIARERSYATARSTGDHTGDEAGTAFVTTTTAVNYVDAVDALVPAGVGTAVAFGDSITDGYENAGLSGGEDQGGLDANRRFPDYLARRLLAEPGGPRLSVVNAGISGNRILVDGQTSLSGPSGLSRLDSDVLGVAGVTDAIVLEGINDIALLASADQVETGLRQIVAHLHAAGVHVLLGTLTPAGTGLLNLGNLLPGIFIPSSANGVRLTVNAWIRSGASGADGIVDFDGALSSPAMPNELNPALDSGDHVHPSYLGYARMADRVDLSTLRGAQCVPPPPRLAPTVHVHAQVRPAGRLRVTGTVTAGGPVVCSGTEVTVRALHAGRTILKRRLRLTAACRFGATSRIRAHGRIEIRVGFTGGATLLATHARTLFVRAP